MCENLRIGVPENLYSKVILRTFNLLLPFQKNEGPQKRIPNEQSHVSREKTAAHQNKTRKQSLEGRPLSSSRMSNSSTTSINSRRPSVPSPPRKGPNDTQVKSMEGQFQSKVKKLEQIEKELELKRVSLNNIKFHSHLIYLLLYFSQVFQLGLSDFGLGKGTDVLSSV